MNYLHPNLMKLDQNIIKKLNNIFGVCMPKKIKNYEHLLTNHRCIILKRVHKGHSGRLLLLHVLKHLNSEPCLYVCMHAVIGNKMKQKFICSSTTFK